MGLTRLILEAEIWKEGMTHGEKGPHRFHGAYWYILELILVHKNNCEIFK